MLALGRLLRLSLAPTALADVAAGIVFAAGLWPSGSAPWLLLASSLCIYHGGMVLNDWADREWDGASRPARPLPSREVSPAVALAIAGILLVVGPLLAFLVQPRFALLVTALVLAIVFYNLGGRGIILGPLLLGLCRAGNLGLGLWFGASIATGPVGLSLVGPPLLYGGYVFTVSSLARLEDAPGAIAPAGKRPTILLCIAALLLLLVPLLPRPAAEPLAPIVRLVSAFLVSGLGALLLLGRAFPREPWTNDLVCRATGAALRCLLLFTAALALTGGTSAGRIVALVILSGFPIAGALRRVFPPS
jgi:hypothetical protein